MYNDLSSYQTLLMLGCRDNTGPIQAKKGVVKLVIPGGAYYHFDPNYKYNNEFVSKAIRQSTGTGKTYFFIKQKKEGDYNLAFVLY